MADRVAIIGGSTAGRDHFPFAVSDIASTGYDTIFPFSLSFEDCLAAFYLAKVWRIVIDVTIDLGDPEVENPHLLATVDVDAGFISDSVVPGPEVEGYERESDLVVPRQTFISLPSIGDDGHLFPLLFGIFNNADEDVAFEFDVGPAVGWSGGQLWPAFYLNIDATIGTASGFNGALESTVELTMALPGSPFAATFMLRGADNYSGTVILSPLEYWPYANSNGDPVYNTTTGAQLTDPLG